MGPDEQSEAIKEHANEKILRILLCMQPSLPRAFMNNVKDFFFFPEDPRQ